MQFIDLKTPYAALKTDIDAAIHRVLDHGQYIMGPEVKALEAALATFAGTKHCVTVSSGTEALLISLMALGLQSGDEVITTPFTFAATAEVIVLLGGRPVFVDVEPDTGLIDAARIEAAITPRTRAIMPVSLYGQCADMDAIHAIAARHGHLPVIEDAAQSLGAQYRGRESGNLSTFGCTSFFPSKPLGCYGDGGAIFTSDDALAQACREIRVHGQSKRYTHTRVGVGGRMDTLQCAIVLAKLERFDWEVAQRQQLGHDPGVHEHLLERAVARHHAVALGGHQQPGRLLHPLAHRPQQGGRGQHHQQRVVAKMPVQLPQGRLATGLRPIGQLLQAPRRRQAGNGVGLGQVRRQRGAAAALQHVFKAWGLVGFAL